MSDHDRPRCSRRIRVGQPDCPSRPGPRQCRLHVAQAAGQLVGVGIEWRHRWSALEVDPTPRSALGAWPGRRRSRSTCSRSAASSRWRCCGLERRVAEEGAQRGRALQCCAVCCCHVVRPPVGASRVDRIPGAGAAVDDSWCSLLPLDHVVLEEVRGELLADGPHQLLQDGFSVGDQVLVAAEHEPVAELAGGL